jgi:ribosomal protein S18 acetylase RimI-like enzyme
MRADPVLVRRLEELCFNAWPALRTVLVGGWVVRLADGHTRRANAASPIHPESLPSGAVIDLIEDLFVRAGLDPVYRLTGLQPPEFEDSLRARGYVDNEPVVVLRSPPLEQTWAHPSVAIAPNASDEWLRDALAAYGYEAELEPGLRRIFDDIVWPCGFATVRHGDRDVAWGLAVVEADHVGLFDLVVASDCRGRGYGRRLVRSLLGWGRSLGARNAYLQVRTENEAALSLYHSLGFTDVYGYRHFVRSSA